VSAAPASELCQDVWHTTVLFKITPARGISFTNCNVWPAQHWHFATALDNGPMALAVLLAVHVAGRLARKGYMHTRQAPAHGQTQQDGNIEGELQNIFSV
jgi:hypothetical protein